MVRIERHSVVSLAEACRCRLALETARFRPLAADLKNWALPVMAAPAETSAGTRDHSSGERITPTAIVILGLAVVIFVAFLVGSHSGSLHPVWQAIVGLAGVGLAGMTLRLVQILRGKVSR